MAIAKPISLTSVASLKPGDKLKYVEVGSYYSGKTCKVTVVNIPNQEFRIMWDHNSVEEWFASFELSRFNLTESATSIAAQVAAISLHYCNRCGCTYSQVCTEHGVASCQKV